MPISERDKVTQFTDLGLSEVLLRALADEGYTTPTPIQAQSIPFLLEGRDLLGIAQTGTGKTAAFALPILDRIVRAPRRPQPNSVRALVIAPTRELAAQIAQSFRAYGKFMRISVGVIVGGESHGPQIKQLARGLDVLVATPGRLLDHMGAGRVRLDTTEVVVLDEADHMLDLGFLEPIRQIVAKLPKARQSLFFSATMPREIAGLAKDMLREPVNVSITPVATTAERVAQEILLVDAAAKPSILLELLARPDFRRTIIFTRTKRGANRVTDHLEAAAISAAAIHGNKSQGQRQRALDDFRRGQIRALVATDIAARGIDVDDVTHVVNYELPDVAETYVHRIGRTARAGREGAAVSLCDSGERGLLRAIERLTRQSLPIIDRRSEPHEQPAAAPSRGPKPAPRNQRQKPRFAGKAKPGTKPGSAAPRGNGNRRRGSGRPQVAAE